MEIVKQLNFYGCVGYSLVLQHETARQTKKVAHMIKNYAENPTQKLLIRIVLEIALLSAMLITLLKFMNEVMETYFYIPRRTPEIRPERLLIPYVTHCEFKLPDKIKLMPLTEEDFLKVPYIITSFDGQ